MNKNKDFLGKINKLNNFHYKNSSQFRKIIDLILPLKKDKNFRRHSFYTR